MSDFEQEEFGKPFGTCWIVLRHVDPLAEIGVEDEAGVSKNYIPNIWEIRLGPPLAVLVQYNSHSYTDFVPSCSKTVAMGDIRIQQRNGRKTLTTVQGIPKEFNLDKMLSALKKKFACNGTVINDEELGKVLQLTGDQRNKVAEWLEEQEIAKRDDIKKHGF
ncbi:translation initiation factor SUI1 [Endogone sp. FLAS-F59071]|nr:translation initiation factor SUI1 [Endogone sp. FLAS-F59071]|eukprot:RUS14045.1 translation initiation factor SUI1 [Endogone sp. FLAS-F59071]